MSPPKPHIHGRLLFDAEYDRVVSRSLPRLDNLLIAQQPREQFDLVHALRAEQGTKLYANIAEVYGRYRKVCGRSTRTIARVRCFLNFTFVRPIHRLLLVILALLRLSVLLLHNHIVVRLRWRGDGLDVTGDGTLVVRVH